MPKPPLIPKETILEAALNILIRDGFSSVNIKTIAKELNCSTQPISWHFGNMNNLRTALGAYAMQYADAKTTPTSTNGLDAFNQVGNALVDLAFDAPYLYRFLFMDGSSGYCIGGSEALTELTDNKELIQIIAIQNHIPVASAGKYLESMIIYTVGILSLCISGVLKCSPDQVKQKMAEAGDSFLSGFIEEQS